MKHLLLPFILLLTVACTAQTDSTSTHIYKIEEVDTMPRDFNVFQKYIYKNLRYPKYEQDNEIEGEVRIAIVIDANGKITTPAITQSAGENMDKEALRILANAPIFSPAMIRDKPVAVYFEVRFKFQLEP